MRIINNVPKKRKEQPIKKEVKQEEIKETLQPIVTPVYKIIKKEDLVEDEQSLTEDVEK